MGREDSGHIPVRINIYSNDQEYNERTLTKLEQDPFLGRMVLSQLPFW